MTPTLIAALKDAPLEYYRLERITIAPPKEGDFVFASAALLTCALCGICIDSMGGPGDGAVCIPCGDLMRRGEARGAIKWDKKP